VLSVGPFAATLLAVPLAIAIAVVVDMRLSRGNPELRGAVFPAIMDVFLVGLLAARIAFIVRWWPLYAADPWSMVRIGDGGYLPWAGVLAAAGFALWRGRRKAGLAPVLWGGLASGAAGWAVALGLLMLLRGAAMPVPDVAVRSLDGAPLQLSSLQGKPLVVNLWATWCPPCLREMPAMAEAQRANPHVTFAFVNQGEGVGEVQAWLRRQALDLEGIYLDPFSDVGREVGSRGLPTTLFYDRQGRLVDTHVGELTRASLASTLREVAPAPTRQITEESR
jgi:thiol-disulfide isomerase/thioredoxin